MQSMHPRQAANQGLAGANPATDSTDRITARDVEADRRHIRFHARWAAAQPVLTAYALGLVGPAGADDLVQECALTCWRRFEDYAEDRDFLAWALGIARNHALHVWRARQRQREELCQHLGTIPDLLAQAVEQESADLALRGVALRTCLEELPPRQRQVLDVVYAGEGDQVAAARQLGLAHGTLRVRLSRLRTLLRACIDRRMGVGHD